MRKDVATHAGRVALVTGAAGALGGAICAELASRGADVVGVDVADAQHTGEDVRAVGGRWLGVKADLTVPAEVSSVVQQIEVEHARLDILVNNAAVAPLGDIDGHSFELWQNVMAVNLSAPFLVISTVLPLMKRNSWGRIVNVGSSSVAVPTAGQTAYKASKMGLIGLTRGVAGDVAEHGIRVNVISPPFMETPLLPDRGDTYTQRIVGRQAIKRLGTPLDAVGLVAFLTSDAAEFITGQTLFADGGLAFT